MLVRFQLFEGIRINSRICRSTPAAPTHRPDGAKKFRMSIEYFKTCLTTRFEPHSIPQIASILQGANSLTLGGESRTFNVSTYEGFDSAVKALKWICTIHDGMTFAGSFSELKDLKDGLTVSVSYKARAVHVVYRAGAQPFGTPQT